MNSLQVPDVIAAAVARLRKDLPPPQRCSALMAELSALPGSDRFSPLGVRCAEFEVTVGSRAGTFSSPIHEVFGIKRVLLPVVHPVSVDAATASIQAVVGAGCKGAFLINQGMTTEHVLDFVLRVRQMHPTLWVGLNLLGMRPAQALRRALAI